MEDDVMALEGVIDYGRLISLAAQFAASDEAAPLRASLRCIYVDDAHAVLRSHRRADHRR